MRKAYIPVIILFVAAVAVMFAGGCSKEEVQSYDDLEAGGTVSSVVRKKYDDFFASIAELGGTAADGKSGADSVLVSKTARLTDGVIGDMRPYPSTFDSRVALDALSFASHDLTVSPGFDDPEVRFFWRNALLDPLFTLSFEYLKTGGANESTHTQLVKALQRAMGNKATDDMLLNAIKIVGPKPNDRIMDICESDSLVFRKVFDLVVYSRSLQEMGPPIWMMTGPWFVMVDIEGWPLSFYNFKPVDVNNAYYLAFRDYSQGEVYASVYNDPVSDDPAQMDGWLTRAAAAIDSFRLDEELPRKVLECDLPTYDAHNYYHDYMISATADTARREYKIILKRERVVQSGFQFAGVDSIEIKFSQREIISRAESVTPLAAVRYEGETMVGGQLIPARRGEGVALLMPMGIHDEEIVRRYQKSLLPQISLTNE